jgi:hypothetical protein
MTRWAATRLMGFVTVWLVVASTAATVRADPYVVGTGGVLVLDFEGDFFRFVGQGFTVDASAAENVGLFFSRTDQPSCDPCRAGDVFNPGFTTNGEILFGTGSATFGTVSYPNLTLHGTLGFDVTPLVFPDTTSDGLLVETPFSFTGFVRGATGVDQAFAADFIGTGKVGRFFDRTESGSYVAGENHITFLFDTPAAPVPEPGTMLLVGGGIAGVAARMRSKAKRRQAFTL